MKRIAVVLICCSWGLAAPATATAAAQADAPYLFALGKLLVDQGEYLEAGEALGEAVGAVPDDPYLRIEYAGYLVESGEVDAAMRQVETATRLAPDDVLILKAAGHLQLRAAREDDGAFAKARGAFETLRQKTPGDLDAMSTLGRIYLSEERFAEAAEVFRQALTYWPQSRSLHGSLIDALLRTGSGPEAESAIEDFLVVAPDSIRARLTLADLRQRSQDDVGAAKVLLETPPRSSGDSELFRRLAVSLYELEHYPEALFWLDRSLGEAEGGDQDSQLQFLRALLLTTLDRDEEARGLLEDLLAEDPDRREVLELLVRHLFGAAEWQEVADLLAPRLVGDLDLPTAELGLLYAETLRRLDRQEEALEWLGRVAEHEELRDRALARQAEALLSLERDGEADEVLARLTESGDSEALMLAAETCQREERYDRSVPFLERVLESDDEPLQALFWLGAAYERTGRKEEAEGQFRRFLEVQPDSAPALNYLGYMWAESGQNLDEALALVQRAVALDPDNGAYLDSLGWAHFQLGNYQEARLHLERAAELVEEDPVVLEHLGDLYQAIGERQRAVSLYQRALDLDAENAGQVLTKLRQLDSP